MAGALSMSALQAALPSVGVAQQVRLTTRGGSSSHRLVVRPQAQRGLKLQAFSGLQRENPLQLRVGSATEGSITSLASNGSRWFAMRHGKRIARLGRPADQRKALVRGLTTELLRHGRIKTTHARARAIRKYADKMITLAKGGSLHERRQALAFIYDKEIVKTMFEQVPKAPEFASRNGGYTRIVRTMPRRGDNAPMSFIELVEFEVGSSGAEDEEEEAVEAEVVAA